MTGAVKRLPPRPIFNICAFDDAYTVLDGKGRYELWHNRRKGYEALFDLEKAPHETRNLVLEKPDRARRLRRLLGSFLHAGRGRWAHPWHYR